MSVASAAPHHPSVSQGHAGSTLTAPPTKVPNISLQSTASRTHKSLLHVSLWLIVFITHRHKWPFILVDMQSTGCLHRSSPTNETKELEVSRWIEGEGKKPKRGTSRTVLAEKDGGGQRSRQREEKVAQTRSHAHTAYAGCSKCGL